VFATLQEVVEFFDRGGGDAPNKSPLLRPLGLSGDEKRDLVAFLESMSMDEPLVVDAPELPPMLPLVEAQAGECTVDAPPPGPLATATSTANRNRGSSR